MLTRPAALPDTADTFLAEHEYEVARVDVSGGTSVIGDSVKEALTDAMR